MDNHVVHTQAYINIDSRTSMFSFFPFLFFSFLCIPVCLLEEIQNKTDVILDFVIMIIIKFGTKHFEFVFGCLPSLMQTIWPHAIPWTNNSMKRDYEPNPPYNQKLRRRRRNWNIKMKETWQSLPFLALSHLQRAKATTTHHKVTWHLEVANSFTNKTTPESWIPRYVYIIPLQALGKVWNQRSWEGELKYPCSLPNLKKCGRNHQETLQRAVAIKMIIMSRRPWKAWPMRWGACSSKPS